MFGDDSDEINNTRDRLDNDESAIRNVSSILKTSPVNEEKKEKPKKLTHTDA